jgi:hypothetical protein
VTLWCRGLFLQTPILPVDIYSGRSQHKAFVVQYLVYPRELSLEATQIWDKDATQNCGGQLLNECFVMFPYTSAEAFDQMLSTSDTGSHKSTISVLVSSRDAAEVDITNKNNQLADTQNKLDDLSYELEVEQKARLKAEQQMVEVWEKMRARILKQANVLKRKAADVDLDERTAALRRRIEGHMKGGSG